MAGPGKPVRKTVPADPGERVPEAMLGALAVRVPPFIQDWTGALWPAMSAILAKRLTDFVLDSEANGEERGSRQTNGNGQEGK